MEVKENPKYYLNPISEDSVEVAEDFFSIEKNETVLVSDSTTIRLYICLFGGAGMIYERFNDNCNIMEQSGKTGTLRYELQKLVMDKVKVYTGILQKHIGDKIQFCLDLYAEDVRFKYVTTTIFFVLALVSFRFAKVSTVFAWISAVSMSGALVFSVISLCRFFYDIVIFIKS